MMAGDRSTLRAAVRRSSILHKYRPRILVIQSLDALGGGELLVGLMYVLPARRSGEIGPNKRPHEATKFFWE